MSAGEFLARVRRDTLVAIAGLAAIAFAWRPSQPKIALGVLGGGLLIGLSYWGVRAIAEVVAERGNSLEKRAHLPRWALVKFFTRHAILALVAYGMMARLELHPMGLLIGVSAPGMAAAFEALRARRP